MAKIVIIAADARSLIANRGDLIKAWIKRGNEIIALVPDTSQDLDQLGIKYYIIPLKRTLLNPLKDFTFILFLIKILKQIRPDIVFSYTIKPVIYGSIASSFAKIGKVYSLITGLGYVYAGNTLKQKVLRKITNSLYKFALKNNKKVFFQNNDDMKLFVTSHLIPEHKAVKINGSGVNTERFYLSSPRKDDIQFLLVSRLIYDKGVIQFIEAARTIKKIFPETQFNIVGPFDQNPNSIDPKEMEKYIKENVFQYLGKSEDVRGYIAGCSVFVLPSYYREGTPKVILEAMSMGKPIITTNAPGCKETVINGLNGLLVPVKDSEALANAMKQFILKPDLIEAMGLNSREIAIEKYDVHKVNKKILEEMELIQ